MDGPARFTPFGVDLVFVTVDHALEFLIPRRPVDRFEQIALHDLHPAAFFPIGLVDPVADNTGNALARDRMPVDIAHEQGLSEVHPHLCVASDTKITIGSVGPLENGALHRVEHGTQLSIGMRGYRPFTVMILVARFTGGCGREPIFHKEYPVGSFGRDFCPRIVG